MSNEGLSPFRQPRESHHGELLSSLEQAMLDRFRGYPNYDARVADEVNKEHGVDIIGQVIPSHIERVRNSDNDRPVAILDLGCGIGILNDQIRRAFGDMVVVYGTTLLRKSSEDKRAKYYHDPYKIMRDRSELKAAYAILQDIGPMMHPNDGKYRSVHELDQALEFDLVFDTYGELFYAGRDMYSQNFSPVVFRQTLRETVQHVLPHGELYIAQLKPDEKTMLAGEAARLYDQYGISIQQRQWHYTLRRFRE